ncbi:hypothetical protein HAX54_047068 [Datura stramonium]|uniref:Uncharacterized protein n=1 Tax=Datura stramonium TaxID=4076 RepID=A0ABS8STE4_DATST|nr:hypothetical protein [Datura stramonium]
MAKRSLGPERPPPRADSSFCSSAPFFRKKGKQKIFGKSKEDFPVHSSQNISRSQAITAGDPSGCLAAYLCSTSMIHSDWKNLSSLLREKRESAKTANAARELECGYSAKS